MTEKEKQKPLTSTPNRVPSTMPITHQDRAKRRKEIAKYAERHGKSKAAAHFSVSETTVYAACRAYGKGKK